MADPIRTQTTENSTTNISEDGPINLEEDEEESRRLENIDNSFIPFLNTNQINPKKLEKIDLKQLEYMRYVLSNRSALPSDDEVKNIQDLWSTSIKKEQRQALYRYWLSKYYKQLTGIMKIRQSIKKDFENNYKN